MVWWIQLKLFIQPFLPCGYIVCLVMVAAGGYYSAGVLRGARGGGSCIVGWWEALSGRGELGERRLLRERVVALLNAGGGRWNRGCYEDRHKAQHTTLHILRTRQNTAAHTEQHTDWGRISCSSCASAGRVHVRSNKTPADQYWGR